MANKSIFNRNNKIPITIEGGITMGNGINVITHKYNNGEK